MRRTLGLLSACALAVLSTASIPADDDARPAEDTLFEIRSYHFEPSRLAEYRAWAEDVALPHLRRELDVVGFWVSGGIPSEVRGAPLDELGSSNVTWIIRWPSKAARDAGIAEVFGTAEWSEIFSQLPGGLAGYLRIESQFFEEL